MKTDLPSQNAADNPSAAPAPRRYRAARGMMVLIFGMLLGCSIAFHVGTYPFHRFYTETCGMRSGGWEEFLCWASCGLCVSLAAAAWLWLARRFSRNAARPPARPAGRPVRSLAGALLCLALIGLAVESIFPHHLNRYSDAVANNWTLTARLFYLLGADEIDDSIVFNRLMSDSNAGTVEGAHLLLEHGVPAAVDPQPYRVLMSDGRMADITVAASSLICDTLNYSPSFSPCCFEERLRVLEALLKRGDDPNLRVFHFGLPLDIVLRNLCTSSSSCTHEENVDFCLRATELLLAHGADFRAPHPASGSLVADAWMWGSPAEFLAQNALRSQSVRPFLHKLLLRHPELKEPILSTLGTEDRAEIEESLRQMENNSSESAPASDL